ncbi:MAG: serine hydrolase domain-containing protein, partial [Chloroflexota bacterium]
AEPSPDREFPSFDRLRDRAREGMERFQVPGVAVGLLVDGHAHAAGFGVTSVENPLPIDATTLFQIGSITKTFTATAVMRLVEAGKLDLDVPIREYLSDLKLADDDATRRVTLRHALTHTGGWVGDFFEDCGPGDDALEKMVAKMAGLEQLTPLGEVWSYNNVAFCLAGRAIEVATGLTFQRAIQELLLDPLGMTRTFFFPEQAITYRCSVGHVVLDEGPRVNRPWTLSRSTHPFAGLISCAADLLTWARFHLGDGTTEDGTRLLKPESLAQMQAPTVPAGSLADAVGITWQVTDVGGARTVGHGGVWQSQMSAFRMVPDRAGAVVVLTNSHLGAQLHGELASWAYQEYFGITPSPVVHRMLSESELAGYAGTYRAALDDVSLEIRDGQLVLGVTRRADIVGSRPRQPIPPPVRLAFVGEDRVVGLDVPSKGARGEFLRHANGSLAWFRWGGRIHAPAG